MSGDICRDIQLNFYFNEKGNSAKPFKNNNSSRNLSLNGPVQHSQSHKPNGKNQGCYENQDPRKLRPKTPRS